MPSALSMQIALLEADEFATNKAEREIYEEIASRWRDKSIRLCVQAACLQELIDKGVVTA